MNQSNTPPNQNPPQQKVSFWKSRDPKIVLVRILLIIFIGLPLLGIIGAMVLVALNSSHKSQTTSTSNPIKEEQVASGTFQLSTPDFIMDQNQKALEIVKKYSASPKLYTVVISDEKGSFQFENILNNTFTFHDPNEKFDIVISIVPKTGEYKVTRTTLKMVDGDNQIPLEKWKIDLSQALEIAKPTFDTFDKKYPNSNSQYSATLTNKVGQNFIWRFVYHVSENYYNNVQQALPTRIDISAETGKILFTK
ncbi:MAG: hypothetical protein UT61_C0016G0005 [Candidatus Woesebacteria bacterium GW2011_GWA1_39_8]|uniref:PepSY domain-containing protein n=1 Tax=Candidatus Woesebacteria bacterium GW2011_GWA1_39_8 TaxID=1618552 RepID=A0A0G0PP93_9BACT|nr:MAG: hypothetical protein UT61_C0016G0005 [Candidatus Woesebacteria bacterium GW2011_GWA1_39_8]